MVHNESMNTPTIHRMSVPMKQDVFDVFQNMAQVLGRSTGSVIAEWLEDTLPAACSATEQMLLIRKSSSVGIARVEAMVQASELLTSDVLTKAQKRSEPGAGGASLAGTPAPGSDPLTPPSSNTGGKVGKSPKTPKGSK